MVIFDKPLYHAVEKVTNEDVVKHRTALMFSSWKKFLVYTRTRTLE